MTRALCVPANRPPIDLTDIDDESTAADVELARILCSRCPVLISCRQNALRSTDVAGFAGGMLESERTAWRTRNHVIVTVATIVDVTPASELNASVLDDLPVLSNGAIHPHVRDVVLRMTKDGCTADDIVAALEHPDVTHRTVNYLRHRFADGPSRVDA